MSRELCPGDLGEFTNCSVSMAAAARFSKLFLRLQLNPCEGLFFSFWMGFFVVVFLILFQLSSE